MKTYQPKVALIALCTLGLNAHAQTTAQLQDEISQLKAEIAVLQTEVSNIQANNVARDSKVTAIQENPALQLGAFLTIDPNPEVGVNGPNITFHGANIHIVSGSGATDDNGNSTGLGNLIIGYDESPQFADLAAKPQDFPPNAPLSPGDRIGAHNLIIGRWHTFGENPRFPGFAFGCFVAGEANGVDSRASSILGGSANFEGAPVSTIVGTFNAQLPGGAPYSASPIQTPAAIIVAQ